MLNPIKKELNRLAHEILGQNDSVDTQDLLEKVQELYKQLVLIEHLETQERHTDSSPAEVVPVMETISEMVTEMPLEQESAAIEDLFATVTNPVFIKKEEEKEQLVADLATPENTQRKSLNDFLGKGYRLDLTIDWHLSKTYLKGVQKIINACFRKCKPILTGKKLSSLFKK
ncbi:hypothetical protein N9D55_01070 [Flavobacteriaceae bacterium]|nr:hypothetical protein [Flavobacteriaceae bacterium]